MKREINDPWIAKETFERVSKVKNKLDYCKWVEFIENNLDYFTWLENTEKGNNTLKNLDNIPQSFRDGIIKGHNKQSAYAEYNDQKGYYEVIFNFNNELGVVGTTFQKKINAVNIKILLSLANHLDAYLLNHGTEIIDESYLENFK
jgi:hypothetical protein